MSQETTNTRRRGKAKKMAVNEKTVTKRKKVIRITLLLLIILAIFTVVKFTYKQVVVPVVDGKNPLSILLIGTDGAALRDDLWGDGKAELTDSIMVITFNPNTYKFEATSIPRDTSIDYTTDVCQSSGAPEWQDQINELYYISGNNMDCVESAITNLTQVPIDYYVKVNMDELVDIIDLVGGVEIVAHAADGLISEPSLDGSESYTWYDGETYTLSGKEALSYVRARHDSEKDYGRGLRQQQVVAATMLKALNGEITTELISEILDIVETDMAPMLIYQYYSYFTSIGDVLNAANSDENISMDSLNKSAWLNIFEYFGYGETKVDADSIVGFEEFLVSENVSSEDIKGYFFTSHQFFNEAYSGHYNVVLEQLQEISDALRTNLELETVTVSLPSAVYGDNEASGLTPMEWATGGSSSSNSNNTSEDTSDQESVVEEPVVEETVDEQDKTDDVILPTDSDSDGVDDDSDICAGFDDTVDTDQDGTPDGCDETPNGEALDSDGDGIADDSDICPGFDDAVDTDKDGTPDGCDDTPNGEPIDSDGDGIDDENDICQGFDDAVDTDKDGTPDGCDDTPNGDDTVTESVE